MKIFTIENGIPELSFDRDLILREDCETGEFCKNAFVIGGIGRLSAEKGFKHLIEAMGSLLTKKPDCKLVLIGEGNQRKGGHYYCKKCWFKKKAGNSYFINMIDSFSSSNR